jgi:hypothetical protein
MVSGRHVVAPKCSKVGKTIVLHSIFIWAWLKKWLTRKIAWFHIPQTANKLWVRYHPNDLNRSHVRILNLSLWHKWPRGETPHPWLQLQWPRWLTGDLRWYTQCHEPPICRVHTTHLWSYWGWFTIEVTTLPDDHVKNTGYQYTLYIYIFIHNFDILISWAKLPLTHHNEIQSCEEKMRTGLIRVGHEFLDCLYMVLFWWPC